jgi:hypothetical protein
MSWRCCHSGKSETGSCGGDHRSKYKLSHTIPLFFIRRFRRVSTEESSVFFRTFQPVNAGVSEIILQKMIKIFIRNLL